MEIESKNVEKIKGKKNLLPPYLRVKNKLL